MDAPSNDHRASTTPGLDSESDVENAIALVTAYFAGAREELVQRLAHRDTSLALFLGAVAVILGAAFRDDGLDNGGATLLLVVPLLGLGATVVHVQHNGVIGELVEYIGIELRDQTVSLLQASGLEARLVPADWNSSHVVARMSSSYARWWWSAILLLVLPQALAVIAAGAELPVGPISLIGLPTGLACIALSLYALLRSRAERNESRERWRQHQSKRRAE